MYSGGSFAHDAYRHDLYGLVTIYPLSGHREALLNPPLEELLRLGGQADISEEGDSHRCAEIDERDVAPVNAVPAAVGPVDLGAEGIDAVEVSEIGYQQHEQHRLPHAQIRRSAEHQSLVQGEQQVQIRKLGEYDGRSAGNRRGGSRGIRQGQVRRLVEVREVGPHEGRDGFDEEEEDAVRKRRLESSHRGLRWSRGRHCPGQLVVNWMWHNTANLMQGWNLPRSLWRRASGGGAGKALESATSRFVALFLDSGLCNSLETSLC